jgi:cytochrome b
MSDPRTRVWDAPIRLFHWLLVLAFFTAYLTEPEEGSSLHVQAGYLALGLVLFRILWGFVGSKHARFTDFVYSPAAIACNLWDVVKLRTKRYLGHSPAGGAMVLALLLALIGTTVSGLLVYGADQHAGPFAGWMAGVSEDQEHRLEELHEVFANRTLGLVVLHGVGVILASVSHRENLVRAMFTGYKRSEKPEAGDAVVPGSTLSPPRS